MYAEVLISINTLINFSLLSFSNKMGSFHQKSWRLWLSAFIGGVSVVLFGGSFLSIVATFVVMTTIAFGMNRTNWILAATNTLIGALFAGGLLTVIQPLLANASWYVVLMVAGSVLVFSLMGVRKNWFRVNLTALKDSYVGQVTIRLFQQEFQLTSYSDTGNQCIEPLSGNPVHFISAEKMKSYLPMDLWQYLYDFEGSSSENFKDVPLPFRSQLRLIRLQTVQNESTWAIGIKVDHIRLKTKIEQSLAPCYIVLTKNSKHFPRQTDVILHASTLFS
ncbi:sigma-E processing peptidase SpoIIGA [Paenisporosarcina sp. HGH0030]|uniref:sigma-E processing peptidase SpoIIGA n=1 Tax=Paenisporosarcina sp. HGH0030 TaxID=1078085 RepID=UPI00034E9DF2|nr:sigma-E processing peptidase SpoIIGA [Paenisporosarcina sp. HGH0030]EPD52874.1 sigma-E processing peptidase SpoIIGA [Paenisporosarcina sp. HGH0030]